MVSAFFPAHGGGIEAVAGRLVRGMAASGGSIQWMAGGAAAEMPEWDIPGVEIERASSVDFIEKSLGLPWPLWGWRSMLKLWRRVASVDVVHVHDYLYMPSLTAILFAKLARKPVVLTQHIGFIPFSSAVARTLLSTLNRTLGCLVLGRASQVVFVGIPVKDYFERFVDFRCRPLLIHNGVDHDVYRYRSCDEKRYDDGVMDLLFVGRFVEKKGIQYLRECMDIPGVRWTFIGKGPLSPEYWPISNMNFRVLGHLSPSKCIEFYRNSDLLVLPSVGEGFPLVVQESLACGTPVLVGSSVASTFPTIDPSCVFSVDPTVEEGGKVRAAVLDAVSKKDDIRKARKNAFKLSLQWSWDNCVAAYDRIYRRLANGNENEK